MPPPNERPEQRLEERRAEERKAAERKAAERRAAEQAVIAALHARRRAQRGMRDAAGVLGVFSLVLMLVSASLLVVALIVPWQAGYTIDARTQILEVETDQAQQRWQFEKSSLVVDFVDQTKSYSCAAFYGGLALDAPMHFMAEVRADGRIVLQAGSANGFGLEVYYELTGDKADNACEWPFSTVEKVAHMRLVINAGTLAAAGPQPFPWLVLPLAGDPTIGWAPSGQTTIGFPLLLSGEVVAIGQTFILGGKFDADKVPLRLGDVFRFARPPRGPGSRAWHTPGDQPPPPMPPAVGYGVARIENSMDGPAWHLAWNSLGQDIGYCIVHFGSEECIVAESPSLLTRLGKDPILQLLIGIFGVSLSFAQLFGAGKRQ